MDKDWTAPVGDMRLAVGTMQGTPVVYFGAGAAIVVLEKLAHLNPDTLPADLMLGLFEADVSVGNVWPERSAQSRDLDDIDMTRAAGPGLAGERSFVCLARAFNSRSGGTQPSSSIRSTQSREQIALVTERPFTFDGRLL